ncbi:ovoinhibitor-like isoform X2 [Antedon mediterranea]|uniref:ovoinhibitor-like isoform X2 n=1 Tax=Antedon mediterranea TaxID=105859 RepID=UPI003AF87B25
MIHSECSCHKMVLLFSGLLFISVMLTSMGGTTSVNAALTEKCTRNCVARSKPVCGSDKRTYPSECHLKKRACVVKDLVKECNGPCKKVKGHSCCNIKRKCPKRFRSSGPVCGTNGVTYPNLCLLAIAICKEKGLKIKGESKCSDLEVTTQLPRPVTSEEAFCIDEKLGKQCSGECKTVNDVHCCDIRTRCPRVFKDSGYVCGTDGVSYVNQCELAKKTCRTAGLLIEKDYDGKCKSQGARPTSMSVKQTSPTGNEESVTEKIYCYDPELGKKCSGECKFVSGVHCCDIRQRCPDELKETGPVCGTDLQTYINMCELARKICRTIWSTLQKLTNGACEEDSSYVIKLGNNSTQSPVFLRLESTSSSPTISTEGSAVSTTSTIRQLTSPTTSTQNISEMTVNTTVMGTTLSINNNINNISHCQDTVLGKDCMAECKFVSGVHCCDIIDSGCPQTFSTSGHVCGSDGLSYDNLCVLARMSCQTAGSTLVKVRYGKCDESSPVIKKQETKKKIVCVDEKRGKTCDGECKVVNGQHCCDIRRRCPNKLKKTGSVCGSDGRTYGNQCALARKSCREHGSPLHMAHKGSCKKASEKRPTNPRKLFPDVVAANRYDNNLPGEGDMTMPPFLITDLSIQRDRIEEDPCEVDCPSWDSPVCGSNMVTYKNACELKKIQCKRPSIRQLCDARCRLDDGRNCCMMMKKCHKSLRNSGTVCGSDGKSYSNQCDLFREACRSLDYNLQQLNEGPCPPDQPQTTKMKFSMIECLSTFHCPIELALAGEVCSDVGTTYQDECALRFDSCWGDNRNIGLDYIGRCKP